MILVRLLSIVLFVVGVAGFFAPFWIGAIKGTESTELPLAEIEDVAVSADNRIYFALMHLGRVQVYSGNGAFIRNFPVSNSGGAFCLEIIGDRLTVAVARRDAADDFDLDGNLTMRDTPITETQYAHACRLDSHIKSVDWAVNSVTVAFTDGNRLVLARRSWHYLALGPFWSWLMFALGMVLWPEWRRRLLERWRRQGSRKPRIAHAK